MDKIAIITADKKLAQLCDAECRLCGYETEIFLSSQSLKGSFVKYLWDIDTVTDVSKLSENCTIRMSSEKDFTEDDRNIHIPPSLKKLRCLINSSERTVNSNITEEPKDLILKDRKTRTISFGDKIATLSEYEFKVLEYLCQNRAKPVKREVLNKILDADSGNISDVYIYHLRKKLEDLCGNRMIKTVRSIGYSIDISLTEL